MNHFIDEVLSKMKNLYPNGAALHEPLFGNNEWLYVKDCIDTGWVSSTGKYVDLYESMLVDYTGIKSAVAVVNGTSALHICLLIAGIKQGDEVIVPALTFVATLNAVTYCGAVPHLVDIEELTLGISPLKLEDHLKKIARLEKGLCINRNTNRPIKAVIAMHTFGHSVDLDPLLDVCGRYNLVLIEDAAEALGSYYKNRHVGHHSKLTALSFNGNKIITSGGGGAILTNDEKLGQIAKHLTTTAKVSHKWEYNHDQVGYNYRLPNLNAALGCAQMEQLDDFINKKRTLAERYKQAFKDIQGLSFFTETEFARSNYWLNALVLDSEHAGKRDALLEALNCEGIMARPAWTLMNKLPMYQDCPKMNLSVAVDLEKRIINIPSSAFLVKQGECKTGD